MNSKHGRQHTKAPLAAALSPFVSLLYPPNPWCEWCDEWRLTTTPGSTSPTLFEQWCGFFYVPQEPGKCKCCETGPTVFRPYARRLESLTVCRYHYKGSTFFSVFKEPECWSGRGSNTWPPDQQTGALPTEPTTLRYNIIKEVPESLSYFLSVLWKLQYWKSLFLRAVFTYKLRRQRFLSFGTVEEGRI